MGSYIFIVSKQIIIHRIGYNYYYKVAGELGIYIKDNKYVSLPLILQGWEY